MASSEYAGRRNSNTLILQELEELSENLYQSHVSAPARRTTSLALPRTAVPPISSSAAGPARGRENEPKLNPKPRTRRMSLSPWRSRPKIDEENEQADDQPNRADPKHGNSKWADEPAVSAGSDKKGIWNWKPMRALSHIGMQKLSCLFSVEVVAVQGLSASMNGLRLSVCVRKKETKEGAVQTMPSRVSQGAADFEETLFISCHVYFTAAGGGTAAKFEPRPFLIYVLAVDAEELDFGKSSVDLSGMIQDSVERNFEGSRIRQWDTILKLSGKAKGGELVLKLGFQIMEKDGVIGIYSQSEGSSKSAKSRTYSPSIGRKQSKSSFSIPSPRMSGRAESWTPSQTREASDLQGIDELDLDEPVAPPPPVSVSLPKAAEPEPETKVDDMDMPEFDVVDKGVEIDQEKPHESEEESEENSDKVSFSSEVVKEVVQDQSHMVRLTELDSIAQQIKALESMMGEEKPVQYSDETMSQTLDEDEDKVTREFLQMFEDGEEDSLKITDDEIPILNRGRYEMAEEDMDSQSFLLDLGKGLGCVVQTRNGGCLAAMNPFDAEVERKDTAKLAMQVSKPLIIQSNKSGFELFQKMAAIGLEELGSEMVSLMPMDEIKGKTAEQIAFEGLASQIIQGRNKEGASSTAARSIASVKSMITAMISGRKERVSTGIWNVNEDPLTANEILASSLQKIEKMAMDALKIQADLSEEDAPFDVSPLDAKTVSASGKAYRHLLDSAISMEDWMKLKDQRSGYNNNDDASGIITVAVLIQLRDPLRQFEAVGGPMITLIHATSVAEAMSYNMSYNEDKKYKLASLQVGGVKVRGAGSKNVWDSDKQRLTALQWLVAYGMGKGGRRGKRLAPNNGPDVLWSFSSRVMADMWLKPIRNPDVKFTK